MKRYWIIRMAICQCISFAASGMGRAQAPNDSAGVLKIHMDMRTLISEGKRLRMGGASIGWEWGIKRNEATLGYYWTGRRGRRDISGLNQLETPFGIKLPGVETDLRFFQAGYWLTIQDWRRWKIATPLEAGIGRAKFTKSANEAINSVEEIERMRIFPVQAAVYGEWKATRWVGTGLQIGYRRYITGNTQLPLGQISGPYYRIRVLVYMQTFYDWRNFVFRKEPLPSPFY